MGSSFRSPVVRSNRAKSRSVHAVRVRGLGADPSALLWHRQPASTWNEALPVGNGRLSAMVFGGVNADRIQLNEGTVWAGEKRNRNNPAGAEAIPEIRRLLFAGKPAEAEQLAEKDVISIPRRLPPYQTLGDLTLRFPGQDQFTAYRRESWTWRIR